LIYRNATKGRPARVSEFSPEQEADFGGYSFGHGGIGATGIIGVLVMLLLMGGVYLTRGITG